MFAVFALDDTIANLFRLIGTSQLFHVFCNETGGGENRRETVPDCSLPK